MGNRFRLNHGPYALFYACYTLYRDTAEQVTGIKKRMPDPKNLDVSTAKQWMIGTQPLRTKWSITDEYYYGLHLFAYLFNPNDVGYELLGKYAHVHLAFPSYCDWVNEHQEAIAKQGLCEALHSFAPQQASVRVTEMPMYSEIAEASVYAFA